MAVEAFTLEQAEQELAQLRGEIDVIGEALTQTDSDPPEIPATGLIAYSATGHAKYTSADGTGAYNTGRMTLGATGPLALTTSLQTIPGLTASLAVGTWHIGAQLLISNPGTASQGVFTFSLPGSGGLTVSNGRFSVIELGATGSVATADFTTFGNTLTSGVAPGTGGLNRVAYIHAIFVVSVAGTISVQMKQAATAACTVVQYGTFAEVFPVT